MDLIAKVGESRENTEVLGRRFSSVPGTRDRKRTAGSALRSFLLATTLDANPNLVDLEAVDSEVTGYIVSYLLPILAAGSPSCGDLVAYGICAALILIVAFAARPGICQSADLFVRATRGQGRD